MAQDPEDLIDTGQKRAAVDASKIFEGEMTMTMSNPVLSPLFAKLSSPTTGHRALAIGAALGLSLSLLLATPRGQAQDPAISAGETGEAREETGVVCTSDMTLNDCFAKTWDASLAAAQSDGTVAAAVAANVATQQLQIQAKATPVAGLASGASGTGSLLDLLPNFAAALGINGFSENDQGVRLDKNFNLGPWRTALTGTIFAEADLFAGLEAALPASVDVTTLTREIGDFDKVDVQVMLTREGEVVPTFWLGRDVRSYRTVLSALHQSALAATVGADNSGSVFRRWTEEAATEAVSSAFEDTQREQLEADPAADVGPGFFQTPISKLETLVANPAQITALVAGLQKVANASFAVDLAKQKALNSLDDLINNQPQLVASATWNHRDDLTGPSGWAATLSFEQPVGPSLNRYFRWAKKNSATCASSDPQGADRMSIACFNAFLAAQKDGGSSLLAAANRGLRISFDASYTETDPVGFSIPADSFTYDLDATQTTSATLGVGAYFSKFRFPSALTGASIDESSSGQTARWDLATTFDNATGDPTKNDRLVATLTLSQKLTMTGNISFSLVYADKPEYLGEVDESLSGRLGLKWTVPEF